MGIINKTSIEWADRVFNPVIGCKRFCPYCYAKKINDRFKFIKNWPTPEWRENTFHKSFPKKPSRIFVNSMSDICYWEPHWIEWVIDKIKKHKQHTFLFLTKEPVIYLNYEFSDNCLLGITVTNQNEYDTRTDQVDFMDARSFLSIEPIQENIDLRYIPYKWVIVGMETGNRKNKIIPELEWLVNIINQCHFQKTPLFMKDSLKSIYGDPIREFPK